MKIKRALRAAIIVLVVLIVGFSALSLLPKPDYAALRAALPRVDPSALADGSLEGSAFLLPVSVKVRVGLEGGRIRSVDLLRHFNGQGKPAEAVVARVLEAQSLDVDTVAGATHSSLTILKAIANALEKGERR